MIKIDGFLKVVSLLPSDRGFHGLPRGSRSDFLEPPTNYNFRWDIIQGRKIKIYLLGNIRSCLHDIASCYGKHLTIRYVIKISECNFLRPRNKNPLQNSPANGDNKVQLTSPAIYLCLFRIWSYTSNLRPNSLRELSATSWFVGCLQKTLNIIYIIRVVAGEFRKKN